MYERFYKFSARPFQLMPDPRLLFKSREHKRALSYLVYGLERREGFVVITGRVGMGKTLLVQTLLADPRARNTSIGRVAMANLDAESVLPMVASAFGLPHKGRSKIELTEALVSRLTPSQARGALLIVDEAQCCNVDALEELRVVSNLQANGRALLQVFLVGQTDLHATLAAPRMEHLRQRIVASHQLQPLEADETVDYIEHRLKVVGWQGDPEIQPGVYERAHAWSEGVPRRLNLIMDRLLLHGFLEQKHELTADDVALVISEFDHEFADSVSTGEGADRVAASGSDPDIQGFADRVVALEKALIAALGQSASSDLLARHRLQTDSQEMQRAQSRLTRLERLFAEIAARRLPLAGQPSGHADDKSTAPATQTDHHAAVNGGRTADTGPAGNTSGRSVKPVKAPAARDDVFDEVFDDDDTKVRWSLFGRRRSSEH